MPDTASLFSDFWKINVGHVGSLIVLLVPIFIAFGRLSEKIDRFGDWQSSADKRLVAMDSLGTTASRQGIALDHQMVMAHESRIGRMENLVGKIDVLDQRTASMAEDLHDLKRDLRDRTRPR